MNIISSDKNYCCLVNTEVLVYLTLKEKLVLPTGVVNVSSGSSVGKIISAIAIHSLIMRATFNAIVVPGRVRLSGTITFYLQK